VVGEREVAGVGLVVVVGTGDRVGVMSHV
jgi:hypothetical protein